MMDSVNPQLCKEIKLVNAEKKQRLTSQGKENKVGRVVLSVVFGGSERWHCHLAGQCCSAQWFC